MTSKQRTLAATVYVDGQPHLAGTREADLPDGVAEQITNGGAWRTDDSQAETAAAGDSVSAPDPDKPDGRASEAAWRSYAVSQGVPEAEAAGLSKDDLRDRFK